MDSITQKSTCCKPYAWHLVMPDKIYQTNTGCLIRTHGRGLDDEVMRIMKVEVEVVVNSRPLTVDTISDADSQISIYFTKQYIDHETK